MVRDWAQLREPSGWTTGPPHVGLQADRFRAPTFIFPKLPPSPEGKEAAQDLHPGLPPDEQPVEEEDSPEPQLYSRGVHEGRGAV